MKIKFIVTLFLFSTLSCEDKLGWIKTPEAMMPTVSAITPATGAAGTTVEISGTNFSTVLSENIVTVNGTTADVIEASPTNLRCIIPQGTTGPVVVKVKGNLASNRLVFTYQ